MSRGLVAPLLMALMAGCASGSAPAVTAPPANEKPLAELVLVRQGTLPIIQTAPHGGREAIPGVEPRGDRAEVGEYRKWGGFRRGADANTDVLAQGIAAEVATLTGREPYLVVAKFQRKYVDANRPPELGLDDRKARLYYDLYHNTSRRFVDEVRRNYSGGLLIDVHGQSKDRDVIMRGTINGRSIERLLRRASVEAVIGRDGLFGQLEARGFRVFPGNDVPPRGHSEDGGFNGGYTLDTYGSHNRGGIDAMLMEFGARYRDKATAEATARETAGAIAMFYEAYLKTQAR